MEGNIGEPPRGAWGARIYDFLSRWGFALLVLVPILAGAFLAATIAVPDRVPGLALDAEQLYRLEVGVLTTVLLYVPVVIFALALNNRAFTEIGTRGSKAHDLGRNHQNAVTEQWRQLQALRTVVGALDRDLDRTDRRLKKLEQFDRPDL